MQIFCGIDFGTTNTVVSICDRSGKLIDSFSVPTILFIPFENQGITQIYIGEEAKEAYESGKNGRYIHSIKISLSDRYLRHTTINRTYVKLEELIRLFLMELRKMMKERWGIEPRNIVLGRPVRFSCNEEDNSMANRRLLESFEMAGFTKIIQLEEPVAASLCFEESFQPSDSKFLIMDLGGGTSDFSLVFRNPAKEGIDKYDVRSIDGIDIGGDNFDEELMYRTLSPLMGIQATFESFGKRLPMPVHLYRDVCRWNAMHLMDRKQLKDEFRDYLFKSDDPVAIHRLRAVIENKMSHKILESVRDCKHQLSDEIEGRIVFNELGLGINRTVPAGEMSETLQSSVDSILEIMTIMTEKEVPLKQIDRVILTGGSSRVGYIRERTEQLSGAERIILDNDFYNSVSKGLALYAHHKDISIMR